MNFFGAITLKSLKQYLAEKYGHSGINALSRAEAIVLGIPYPLRKGWFQVYKDMAITGQLMKELESVLVPDSRKVRNKLARKLKKARKGDFVPKTSYEASDAFLASYEWRKVRFLALKRGGGRCAACGARPEDGVRLNVDHIKPRALFPQLALDVDNLQVLCELCNHGKGNWDMTDFREKERHE